MVFWDWDYRCPGLFLIVYRVVICDSRTRNVNILTYVLRLIPLFCSTNKPVFASTFSNYNLTWHSTNRWAQLTKRGCWFACSCFSTVVEWNRNLAVHYLYLFCFSGETSFKWLEFFSSNDCPKVFGEKDHHKDNIKFSVIRRWKVLYVIWVYPSIRIPWSRVLDFFRSNFFYIFKFFLSVNMTLTKLLQWWHIKSVQHLLFILCIQSSRHSALTSLSLLFCVQ